MLVIFHFLILWYIMPTCNAETFPFYLHLKHENVLYCVWSLDSGPGLSFRQLVIRPSKPMRSVLFVSRHHQKTYSRPRAEPKVNYLCISYAISWERTKEKKLKEFVKSKNCKLWSPNSWNYIYLCVSLIWILIWVT